MRMAPPGRWLLLQALAALVCCSRPAAGAAMEARLPGAAAAEAAAGAAVAADGARQAASLRYRLNVLDLERAAAGRRVDPEARVVVRDLAEERPQPSPEALFAARGFAVLRPALSPELAGGHFRGEELKAALRRKDIPGALSRFAHDFAGLRRLGFLRVACGLPDEVRIAPAASHSSASASSSTSGAPSQDLLRVPGTAAALLRGLLLSFPSVVQLVKVWMPLQVPVQPLAMMDVGAGVDLASRAEAGAPTGRWWWHSGLRLGDALVIDALRSPHRPFALPGEDALARASAIAASLREALSPSPPSSADSRPPEAGAGARAGGGGGTAPLRTTLTKVVIFCGAIDHASFEPPGYPVVGGRYVTESTPSALVRRGSSVESNVIAEIVPGSVVTVLAVSEEEAGRAKVYTEHATPSFNMDAFENGGQLQGISQPPGSVTGWITSATYGGDPLLHLVDGEAAANSEERSISGRLTRIGSALRGICSWANVTLTRLGGRTGAAEPPSSAAAYHTLQALEQRALLLTTHIDDAHLVAVEAQCLAVVAPGRYHALALLTTLAALAAAPALLWRRQRPRQPCSGGGTTAAAAAVGRRPAEVRRPAAAAAAASAGAGPAGRPSAGEVY